MLCESLTMSDKLYNAVLAYKENDKLIDENPKNLKAFNKILQGLDSLSEETDEYNALRKNIEARIKEIESTQKTVADLIAPSFEEVREIATNEFIGKIIANDYYGYDVIIFVDKVEVTRHAICVKGTTLSMRTLRIDSSKADSHVLFYIDDDITKQSKNNKIIDKEYLDTIFEDTIDYKRFQIQKLYDSIQE